MLRKVAALTAGRVNKRAMSSCVFQTKCYINGEWVSSKDTFPVKNPANQAVIAEVPNLTADDAQRAIKAAKDAFYSEEWFNMPAKGRAGLLKVSFFHVKVFSFEKSITFRTGAT